MSFSLSQALRFSFHLIFITFTANSAVSVYSWLWQGGEIQFDLASHALEAQQGRTIIIRTWLLFFICSHFYLVGWLWSGMFKVQLTCSTVSGVEISSPLRIMDRCVRTSATWSEFSPKSSDVQLSAANKWNTPLTTLDVKCHFKWRKPDFTHHVYLTGPHSHHDHCRQHPFHLAFDLEMH